MRNDQKLMKMLKKKGWKEDRVNGSHHIFVHPNATRSIPVAVHSKDMNNRVFKDILKEAEEALRG